MAGTMTRRSIRLFSDDEWNQLAGGLKLPARQLEIVRRVAVYGQTDAEIAIRLGISVSTIRVHLGRALRRLSVANRTQLVIEVFRRFRELKN